MNNQTEKLFEKRDHLVLIIVINNLLQKAEYNEKINANLQLIKTIANL
jgi:hypothetical protein